MPIFLGSVQAIGVDPAGNVVLADFNSKLLRRIAPSGAVSLAAGLPGVSGVAIDGVANRAQFIFLGPIASDGAGVLYVTDNYGVRRIAADGTTSFLAGSPTDANVVDGNATTARFFEMRGIAVGPGGNVFVSDSRAIRRISADGTTVSRLAVADVVDGLAVGADGTVFYEASAG